MAGFGGWLQQTTFAFSEVARLRTLATNIGANWPAASSLQADYESSINNSLAESQKSEALAALRAVWPIYELDIGGTQQQPSLFSSLFGQVWRNVQAVGTIIPALAILYLFYLAFGGLSLTDLAKPDIARGLLTFLFGVTTVGIAIIVVLSVFLGQGTKEDLGERFQRGKDILTILIGVFGAILGFYFGSAGGPGSGPPPAQQAQVTAPGTGTAATQPRSQGQQPNAAIPTQGNPPP